MDTRSHRMTTLGNTLQSPEDSMNIRADIKHLLLRYFVAPEDVRARHKIRQENEAPRAAMRRPRTEVLALAKNYLAEVRAAALRDAVLVQEARRNAYCVDRVAYLAARGRVARLAYMTNSRRDSEPAPAARFIGAFHAEVVRLLAYETRFHVGPASWHMGDRDAKT